MKIRVNLLIITITALSLNSIGQNGVVNNGANLVIENGITFYLNGAANFVNLDNTNSQNGTIDLDGNIVISGNWLNSLSHEVFINENSEGTVSFNGLTSQVIEGTAINNFENVILDNNQGLELNGNVSVSNSLTLNNGYISLNDYNLQILENATLNGNFSDQKLIIADQQGELQKFFNSSTGSFLFPVGNKAGSKLYYSPVEFTFNSASLANEASININLKGVKLPANTSLNDYLNRYWTISQNNFSDVNYDLLMYYNDDDIMGDEQNIYGAQFNGSEFQKYDQVSTTTNSISFSGLTGFSDFTGIEGDIAVLNLSNSSIINLFPNPGDGKFFIKFINKLSTTNDVVVRVYSSEGVLILDRKLSDWINNNRNLYEFDLSNYASGIYMVTIIDNKNIYTRRLIII